MEILISHAAEDEPVAAALKDMIERCSLNRIKAWFSSDRGPLGGMPIGGGWFAELNNRLKNAQWIIAIITPQSIFSPWLYFECGFVACASMQNVIPLTLGVPVSHVSMPLAAYQMYDVANAASLATFLHRILEADGILYDDEMMRPVRDRTQRRMIDHQASMAAASKTGTGPSASEDIAALKNLIEQRFSQLYEKDRPTGKSMMPLELKIDISNLVPASKPLILNLPPGSTVYDVLSEIYYRISDHVHPFTYLIQWVIKDSKKGVKLSLAEVAGRVPANLIFSSDRTYEIRKLPGSDEYVSDALMRAGLASQQD